MKLFKRKNTIKKEKHISELREDELSYDICLEAIKCNKVFPCLSHKT
jgi:hypothetical protein